MKGLVVSAVLKCLTEPPTTSRPSFRSGRTTASPTPRRSFGSCRPGKLGDGVVVDAWTVREHVFRQPRRRQSRGGSPGGVKLAGTATGATTSRSRPSLSIGENVHAADLGERARARRLRRLGGPEPVERQRSRPDALLELWWPDEATFEASGDAPQQAAAWEDVPRYAKTTGMFWLMPRVGARSPACDRSGLARHRRCLSCAPTSCGPRTRGSDACSSSLRRWRRPSCCVNGDPNFRTPDHIVESAAEAAFQGATGYAPGAGVQELRDAVADKVTTRNGLRASSDEVCITTGACGGLYTSLMLTVGPGDEVLVPDPGWSNYAAMVHVLGADLSPYPVGPTEHWGLDPAAVEARVNERTRLMLVNSPANPSGVVESPPAPASRRGGRPPRPVGARGRGLRRARVRRIRRPTGAGLGSGTCHQRLQLLQDLRDDRMAGRLRRRRHPSSSATGPAPGAGRLLRVDDLATCALRRFAGTTGLRGRDGRAYRARRDAVVAQLDAFGCGYHLPGGAFFIMVDISPTGLDSWSFSRSAGARERSASFRCRLRRRRRRLGAGDARSARRRAGRGCGLLGGFVARLTDRTWRDGDDAVPTRGTKPIRHHLASTPAHERQRGDPRRRRSAGGEQVFLAGGRVVVVGSTVDLRPMPSAISKSSMSVVPRSCRFSSTDTPTSK